MVMKHYPPEFRAETVALYRSRPGATIKSVVQDFGVNHETLRNWIRHDDAQRAGGPPRPPGVPGGLAGGRERHAAQRVRELEEERDILRKAARYFATETRW
ncbi:transposase [Saccharothrix sp. NRRL B-16348]|nr:transposase [Saccharothrix sp. NRRL B-16348]